MRSTRKNGTPSLRFPRGLELCVLAGIVALAVYGARHMRISRLPAEPPAKMSVVEGRSPGKYAPACRPVCEKSPRQLWLERTLAALDAECDSDKRETMLAGLVKQIPLSEIPLVLADLQDRGNGGSDYGLGLIRRWAGADGRAAAAWAEQLPAGPLRDQALNAVAVGWSNVSLADAAAWAGQLLGAPERQAAMLAVATEAVRTDSVGALRLAVQLADDQQRDELIRRAATEWAMRDAADAVAWAEKIPDATLRAKVLAAESVSWAEQDPEAAATLAVEQLPAGRLQEDAVISIIQRWAQQEPAAAMAWARQFPSGPLRNTAMENAMAQVSLPTVATNNESPD